MIASHGTALSARSIVSRTRCGSVTAIGPAIDPGIQPRIEVADLQALRSGSSGTQLWFSGTGLPIILRFAHQSEFQSLPFAIGRSRSSRDIRPTA